MTNLEWIRSMTLNEMVRMLGAGGCNCCVYCEGMCVCPEDKGCADGIEQWLNKEVSEAEGIKQLLNKEVGE